MDISKLGLVLEGGGMRGVFTCGVLDYFIDHKLEFPYVIGVSAGSGNGLSYISKQRGRGKELNIDFLDKYKYIGFKHFLKKRNFIDTEFLFHTVPESISLYDFEAYFSSKQRFEIVTSNCLTGEANYLEERQDPDRLITLAEASSSLPFLCSIVYVDGVPMLDGGIVDSIPIERARTQGYAKNVVVLTRNRGYRKKERRFIIPPFLYKQYPELRKSLENRNEKYNAQLELVEQLEDNGEVIVIRPNRPVEVDRLEKDTSKLLALYEHGYEMAQQAQLV